MTIPETSRSTPLTRTAKAEQTSPWQRYGWLMSVVWLGFLYYPAVGLLESNAEGWAVTLGWSALVAFALCYLGGFILGMRDGWHAPSRPVIALFLADALFAALTIPALGWGATSFLPFLMAYASYVLGVVWHWVTATLSVLLTLAAVVATYLLGQRPAVMLLAVVVVMFVVNSINVWLITRSITADILRVDLATSEERESVARDVHDLIGHSLTVVKLKAELAMRLVENNPEAAKAEMSEIIRLTGEAISGVRSTVTGLRADGLAEQVSASTSALESAGITVTVVGEVTALSPAQAITTAWILREATTNVLRHARASKVEIAFAPGTARIHDNGIGEIAKPGNGLRGMAERAAAAGAVLHLESSAERGTEVSLTW
ncbi:histidine kinase [Leucobacter sp. UT-8R-CII-1-4]|uniref:sensor histidine kinase n=1 Tax=Leucobacter sp. UT-8R-CII-1-4 TaxID=3040075 RepID=UPI0024A97A14|nr:histidine kinase [Leucobacter sp. UT-8R-CII-1-4]MDI6023359.1 histidine kinase [Leucobacter sp. UT-8R-CII-1-4]